MELPLSISQYLSASFIIIAGSLLQGSVGFGMGLIAVPLLLLIHPAFVPGPLILTSFFLNILVSHREREGINFSQIGWIIIGRLFGTLFGAIILVLLPKSHVSMMLGILILSAVGMSMSGVHIPLTNRNLISVGTLSGFMATTTAIGGPPLALLYQKERGIILRGNLAGIFLIGTILSTLALIIIGKFGLTELLLSIELFPGTLIGFFLSGYTAKILDGRILRPAVLTISTISALVVILKNLP
jgi:uncharacterized membrane protein YfcA